MILKRYIIDYCGTWHSFNILRDLCIKRPLKNEQNCHNPKEWAKFFSECRTSTNQSTSNYALSILARKKRLYISAKTDLRHREKLNQHMHSNYSSNNQNQHRFHKRLVRWRVAICIKSGFRAEQNNCVVV